MQAILALDQGTMKPGVTTGRGSDVAVFRQMQTKFANGSIDDVKPQTAWKMWNGIATESALGEGTMAGVAAGYGFSQLTGTQPARRCGFQ